MCTLFWWMIYKLPQFYHWHLNSLKCLIHSQIFYLFQSFKQLCVSGHRHVYLFIYTICPFFFLPSIHLIYSIFLSACRAVPTCMNKSSSESFGRSRGLSAVIRCAHGWFTWYFQDSERNITKICAPLTSHTTQLWPLTQHSLQIFSDV